MKEMVYWESSCRHVLIRRGLTCEATQCTLFLHNVECSLMHAGHQTGEAVGFGGRGCAFDGVWSLEYGSLRVDILKML
jgi:hypothetical protein